jgi:hypothetical protein
MGVAQEGGGGSSGAELSARVRGRASIEPDVDIDLKALKVNGASLSVTFSF